MRKLIAILIVLAYLALCIFIFGTMGTLMTELHPALQLFFYVIVGVIWILPLKRLFAWMNTPAPTNTP